MVMGMCEIKNATTATSNGLCDNGSTSGILADHKLLPNVGRRQKNTAFYRSTLSRPPSVVPDAIGDPFLVASNALGFLPESLSREGATQGQAQWMMTLRGLAWSVREAEFSTNAFLAS